MAHAKLTMVVIPQKMRQINQRALVASLRKLGTASRAELAKALGMSQPTAGKIVDQLLDKELIEEVIANEVPNETPRPNVRLGRPGRLLQLANSKGRFIAIQLGVQETGLAVLPVAGTTEDNWTLRFPTPKSHAAWLSQIKSLPLRKSSTLWGVIMSAPGIVDENTGRILYSPNLHWSEDIDLQAALSAHWNLPVILIQEIQALALGHLTLQDEPGDFLLVDFGDGVGSASVIHGKLSTGPLPILGELGHTPVPGNKRACGCGATGCMETLVSQTGLLESFREAEPSEQPQWPNLIEYLTHHPIPPWLDHTLDTTAAVIAGSLNVLGLHKLVVTGCLSELGPAVMESLGAKVKSGALWAKFGDFDYQVACRHRAAGLATAGIDRIVMPNPNPPS